MFKRCACEIILRETVVCERVVCERVVSERVVCERVVCDKVVCDNGVFDSVVAPREKFLADPAQCRKCHACHTKVTHGCVCVRTPFSHRDGDLNR